MACGITAVIIHFCSNSNVNATKSSFRRFNSFLSQCRKLTTMTLQGRYSSVMPLTPFS